MDKNDLEKRKKEFTERLTNDLFVERYDSFKESIELINMALENFGIDHKFNYNEFCKTYIEESMIYLDNNPTVDLMDSHQLYFHTLPILMNILEKTRNKYGIKNME